MIAVVVPAYNEEKLIRKTIATMPDYVDRIIIVDDASRDDTFNVAKSMYRKYGNKLKIIRHRTNQGVGGAIVTGYKKALREEADVVAVMAGDAQMAPENLYKLLDPIIEDRADYTKGNRLFSKELERMPRRRRGGNALLTLLTKMASGYWDIIDPQNGYAAVSRRVLEIIDLDRIHKRYGYCNDILVKLNIYNFRVMDVVMPPVYGDEKSGIKIRSYTFKMSWLLLKSFFHRISKKYGGLRFHPLILFYFLGLILFLTGIVLGLDILIIRITGGFASDGTMILTSLLLIMGIQLLLFALLFDMLSSRYGTEKESGKTPDKTKRFHPTIIGLFRRISGKYWNSHFHPIALFYGMGIVLAGVGILLGVYVLYYRIFYGIYSIGSITLTALLIIIGFQSIFFAMIFEMETYRMRKGG
jgi:glycosyltransferase involved in cell wall biosynthesis